MASENETVETGIAKMRLVFCDKDRKVNERCEWCRNKIDGFLKEIESAWRREKAELERKVHEHHLAFLAERARHTETYKDERIRAQDAEIATLKVELAELHGALKKAYGTLYSISCARYGEGLTCTDDIHELVTMARECSDALYANENLRKVLKGDGE